MILKTSFRLLLIALMVLGRLIAQNSSDFRLVKFKEKIGYKEPSTRNSSIDAQTPVICGIPDISNCPTLDGFQISDESLYIILHGNGVDKRIRLNKGKQTLDVTFYYFPNNFQQAEDSLFKILSFTNLPTINGERGPLDLGNISIILPDPYGADIYFQCSNILTYIHTYDKNIDAIAIARWIQSQFQMQPWSEVQLKQPKPMREIIGKWNIREGQALLNPITYPLQGKVGDPIELSVTLPSGDKGQDFDRQRLSTRQSSGVIIITPTKPGPVSFRYMVIEQKTLLFSTYEIPIDVQP